MSKSIDILMKEMPPYWRIRWCKSNICACSGAANCSGGLLENGITYDQWQQWLKDNNLSPYKFDMEEHMKTIKQYLYRKESHE